MKIDEKKTSFFWVRLFPFARNFFFGARFFSLPRAQNMLDTPLGS